MQVGVKALRKITKGLCGNNRSGDGVGLGHRGLQEGFQAFPGATAKVSQQFAIMKEEAAEDLGDGEHEVPVGDGPEHMTAEPLAELQPAARGFPIVTTAERTADRGRVPTLRFLVPRSGRHLLIWPVEWCIPASQWHGVRYRA